jgi:deoxyribonuclease IV
MAKVLLGAHMSIAKGVYNAIYKAKEIDANAIQIFTANQRQWTAKEIPEEDIEKFLKAKKEYGIERTISHSSYLINLGSFKDNVKNISKKAFLQEIERCNRLQIDYLVFHPGSAVGGEEEDCLENIVESILSFEKELLKGKTKLLLETTAGQGRCVGYKFEHLDYIIKKVKNRIPIGTCLDTCHIFAAGYDIRDAYSFKKTLDEFDKIVGLEYLKALHVNDSKMDFNSRKDRHESIGKGKIGIECFKYLMQEQRLTGKVKILETPNIEVWKDEIELLKKFAG